ncbi:MAG: class I SAM-dependent methyltransferase [Candidatus Brocadiaceae bacterium]|jgi:SAM-dependent methyltransferase
MADAGGYRDEAWLAELYDFVPGYAGRPDVGFYVARATAADGPVLELGCGTGRVLIPVARAGCETVGLDISEHMLRKCREKLAREPAEVRARVRLVTEDMTGFDLGAEFGLITTPFRPFQHLVAVEQQLACLECVRKHLAPDGRFILDVFNPDPRKLTDPTALEEREDFADLRLPDGRTLRRTHRFSARHPAVQCNDVELIYYVTDLQGDTERHVHAFPFRYFYRYEVEHLLARAGLRVVELLGSFDGSPFADDSPEMIFVTALHAAA